VSAEPGAGIHEDQRLEDLAGMDNGQVQRAGGDHIDPDEPMLRIQAADEELLPVQTGKQRPEDRRSAFRRMDRFRRRNGTALAHEGDAVPRDTVFPNRAQWPYTVRGTERAINGHVRLLLKLCSSPTLHKPRVGRNEGGGTGLSQRAGLEGRRPARRGPGRPVPLLPSPGSHPLETLKKPRPNPEGGFAGSPGRAGANEGRHLGRVYEYGEGTGKRDSARHVRCGCTIEDSFVSGVRTCTSRQTKGCTSRKICPGTANGAQRLSGLARYSMSGWMVLSRVW
jgi:hypothetical protein